MQGFHSDDMPHRKRVAEALIEAGFTVERKGGSTTWNKPGNAQDHSDLTPSHSLTTYIGKWGGAVEPKAES
jgi:hypothetical protein